MEQILNLIKDNEQFKKYVQLVRTYDELPYFNKYQNQESYKTDPVLALLECLNFEQVDDELIVSIQNGIGRTAFGAEQLGRATYQAVFTRDGDNLNYQGTIDAKFNSSDSSMFGGKTLSGGGSSTDIPLLYETQEYTYENMGYLMPTNIENVHKSL